MLGCDERIPWIPTIDRRMGTLSRTIAVCAIETPDWLMQRHLQETKAEASFPQNTVRDGPAAGYKLHPMLNFCNWLSQKDGISTPTIFIPPTPTKEEAQRDPNSLLSAKCFWKPMDIVCPQTWNGRCSLAPARGRPIISETNSISYPITVGVPRTVSPILDRLRCSNLTHWDCLMFWVTSMSMHLG